MSSMWVQTVFRCTLLLVLVNAKADMDDVVSHVHHYLDVCLQATERV